MAVCIDLIINFNQDKTKELELFLLQNGGSRINLSDLGDYIIWDQEKGLDYDCGDSLKINFLSNIFKEFVVRGFVRASDMKEMISNKQFYLSEVVYEAINNVDEYDLLREFDKCFKLDNKGGQ